MRFHPTTRYQVKQPEFGNWVKVLQTKKGIKNSGFSNKIDGRISASTVKDVHQGKRSIFTGRTLNVIAVELEVPFEELPYFIGPAENQFLFKLLLEILQRKAAISVLVVLSISILIMLAMLYVQDGIGNTDIRFTVSKGSDENSFILFDNRTGLKKEYGVGFKILKPQLIFYQDKGIIIVSSAERLENTDYAGITQAYDLTGKQLWEKEYYSNEKTIGRYSTSGYFFNRKTGRGYFFGEKEVEYYWIALSEPRFATSRFCIIDPKNGETVYSFWSAGRLRDVLPIECEANESKLLISTYNNDILQLLLPLEKPELIYQYASTAICVVPEKFQEYATPNVRFGKNLPIGSIQWIAMGHPFNRTLIIGKNKPDKNKSFPIFIQGKASPFVISTSCTAEGGKIVKTEEWYKLYDANAKCPPLLVFRPKGNKYTIEVQPHLGKNEFKESLERIYGPEDSKLLFKIAILDSIMF